MEDQLMGLVRLIPGPWGALAAVGVVLLVRYLKARKPDLIQIPKPTDPQPEPVRFPLLSKIKNLFGAAKVIDLTPEAIEALRVELDDLAGALFDAHEEKRAAFSALVRPVDPQAAPVDSVAPVK